MIFSGAVIWNHVFSFVEKGISKLAYNRTGFDPTGKYQAPFCFVKISSPFQALGQWGRSKKWAGNERGLVEKKESTSRSSLIPSVTDPARHWSRSPLIPLVTDPARHWSRSSLIPLGARPLFRSSPLTVEACFVSLQQRTKQKNGTRNVSNLVFLIKRVAF